MQGVIRWLLTLLLVSVAGCTSTPQVSPLDLQWGLEGKLSLRTGGKSQVLGVDWRQYPELSDISLTGPLGVRVARISATETEVLIDTGSEVVRYDENAVLTSPGVEGLKLPWKALSSWVRGLDDKTGANLRERGLTRGNWRFRVLRHKNKQPDLMVLEHPQITLRLKVKKWLNPSDQG